MTRREARRRRATRAYRLRVLFPFPMNDDAWIRRREASMPVWRYNQDLPGGYTAWVVDYWERRRAWERRWEITHPRPRRVSVRHPRRRR